MKITRRQLRRLISEAITDTKKGALGQIPYRDPGAEIRSNLSPEQLEKFDTLKDTEPAVRDSIASGLGYEGEFFGDDEFDFKAKMAAQDPDEKVYQMMYRYINTERINVNHKAQQFYAAGYNDMADSYDKVEIFLSELLKQNLAPVPALDAIFNKISQLQSSERKSTSAYILQSIMESLAREAVRLNYIVDEQISRKYLGDAGSNPFDDYMNQLFKDHPGIPEDNPVDPTRKRRFK